MAILSYTCPHPECGVQHIGLVVVETTTVSPRIIAAHLKCPKCKLPSSATLYPHGTKAASNISAIGGADVLDHGWAVKDFWPAAPQPLIPELLHPDIVRVYIQAERNFPVPGNEEAAGTMYGKALDVALKKFDPALTGTLANRINALAKQGKITTNLEEWSTHVRWLRNDAAHEEEPFSREDLTDLRNFTEMVLRYLFTLPNMVKKRRGELLPWEPPAEA